MRLGWSDGLIRADESLGDGGWSWFDVSSGSFGTHGVAIEGADSPVCVVS